MRAIYILFFLIITFTAFSQERIDTFYYDEDWKLIDPSAANYISYFIYNDATSKAGTIKSTTVEGVMISECSYSNIKERINEGICTKYKNGNIWSIIEYSNNKYDGMLKTYYTSGKLRRHDIYSMGELVSGNYYTESGEDSTHFPFMQMPDYPGGAEAIYKLIANKIKYPKKAKKNDIEGKVYVEFIIDKKGNLIDERIKTSVHPLLDEEAIRVVRMLQKWKPGIQDGEPVNVTFVLPINFKLID